MAGTDVGTTRGVRVEVFFRQDSIFVTDEPEGLDRLRVEGDLDLHVLREGVERPRRLIDENLPVVVLATSDPNSPESRLLFEKTMSNIQEVKARGGYVLAIACEGEEEITKHADHVLWVPPSIDLLLPILEIVPLQLLAYDIEVRRGCDVDQPRNLAKSVTVE